MREQAFTTAIMLAEDARRAGIADASVFGLLGQALSEIGDDDAARAAYGEALKLSPEDVSFRYLSESTDCSLPARPATPRSGPRPSLALAEHG